MRIAFALLLCACATVAPAPTPPAAKPPPSEAELLAPKIAALAQHAAAVEAARDDALWAYWVGETSREVDPWTGHEVLLDFTALDDVRRARELGISGDLEVLEQLIVAERIGRATREAEASVVNLEASLRFQFEGREVPYRDLPSTLANEKSPARRQALWAASVPAAQQLAAAVSRRDHAQDEELRKMDLTRERFAELLRHMKLAPAQAWAERFLSATESRWKERLVNARVATRADLPAMLKTSGNLDAAFPKGRIAERGTQLLASLGLYGVPKLTLDLTDNPRKQPLPLTVSGVRMSFKPRGGWKDQQALFAELGRALALHYGSKADRLVVETSASLFGSLVWNRGWLEEQGVAPATANTAPDLAADTLLLTLRRAAASAIGSAGAMDRAYGLPDEPERSFLDVERLYAGVDTLRAHSGAFALARHLEVEAGPKWWSSPKAAEVLKVYWQLGELPEPVRAFAASGEALLAALGAPTHGGVTSPGSGTDPPAR